MKYEGDSKQFDNSYHDAYAKITSIGYTNIVTGFRLSRALEDDPDSNLPVATAGRCRYEDAAMLNIMAGKGADYILLPAYKVDPLSSSTAPYYNIVIEKRFWVSVRSIKAATIKCTKCGTVFKKDKIKTPTCCMCKGAYNIKAGKKYHELFKKVNFVNIYSGYILNNKETKCAIVKCSDIADEYNLMRGFTSE